MPDISTLKEDMEHVLRTGEGWTKEIADWVSEDIHKTITRQMESRGNPPSRTLRLSSLGHPCDRKGWYDIHHVMPPEPLQPSTIAKFIFGDMTESFLLGLAMAAGHTVEGLQETVYVEGVRGSQDAIIDGMVVDVKSAATFSFDKFKYGRLRGYHKFDRRTKEKTWVPANEVDGFGYISQLSSYLYANKDNPKVTYKDKAAFLAFDKQHAHIALDIYDLSDELSEKPVEVQRKKLIAGNDSPPVRQFKDIPHNKSGNMQLQTICGYCSYKEECWPDLRIFVGGSKPLFLTKVVKEPGGNYFEVTEELVE